MKKNVNLILRVIIIVILLFIIDLICIFSINKPLLAIKNKNSDSVNIIYKGLIYDTYFCNNYSTTHITYKGSNFTCDDTIKINKFIDYNFSVMITTPSEGKKIFAFYHDNINYYYGNTNFTLYLIEGKYKYDLETAMKNDLISLENILNKAINIEVYKDGISKLYHYHQFDILICDTINRNTNVIIGESDMNVGNYCE